MKPQSHFSNCSNDDLIEFSEDTLTKIGKLRKAIKQLSTQEIEKMVQVSLSSQGIKTYHVTEMYQSDGQKIIHTNNWLSNGVACRILKLGEGNQQWQQGKIKLRLEIEFEPNESQSKAIDAEEIFENETGDDFEIKNSLSVSDVIGERIETQFKNMGNEIDRELEELRGKLNNL
jgi:hypothetical protein